jgi:hypothetical protein
LAPVSEMEEEKKPVETDEPTNGGKTEKRLTVVPETYINAQENDDTV